MVDHAPVVDNDVPGVLDITGGVANLASFAMRDQVASLGARENSVPVSTGVQPPKRALGVLYRSVVP